MRDDSVALTDPRLSASNAAEPDCGWIAHVAGDPQRIARASARLRREVNRNSTILPRLDGMACNAAGLEAIDVESARPRRLQGYLRNRHCCFVLLGIRDGDELQPAHHIDSASRKLQRVG